MSDMREMLWSGDATSGFMDKLRRGIFDADAFEVVHKRFENFLNEVHESDLEDSLVGDILMLMHYLGVYVTTVRDPDVRNQVSRACFELEDLIEDKIM